MSFVRRLSSLGGSKCIEIIGKEYFGTSRCVLCREVVLVSECPLSEIPLNYCYCSMRRSNLQLTSTVSSIGHQPETSWTLTLVGPNGVVTACLTWPEFLTFIDICNSQNQYSEALCTVGPPNCRHSSVMDTCHQNQMIHYTRPQYIFSP